VAVAARVRYVLGLDLGTESARAVLVPVDGGPAAASASHRYRHGVIDRALPEGGPPLPAGWVLAWPLDWLEAIEQAAGAAIVAAGATPDEVIAIGLDATSCTIVPAREDGTPLCVEPAYRGRRHAWPTLWKHQAAHAHAERLTAVARSRGERWLDRYGGALGAEWMLPKALQLLEEDAETFAAARYLVEAADWVAWQLTGRLARNACAAAYKAGWSRREGYPSPEYLAALVPALGDLTGTKLAGAVLAPGDRLGGLRPEWAARLGLRPGTPFAVPIIDAHAAVLGAGVGEPGTLLSVMGTSGCHMLLSRSGEAFPGVVGVVEDGVLPGLYACEAGQPAVGDQLAWLVASTGAASHEQLARGAAGLRPGESGLLALDWLGGNRSVLRDAGLSGLLVGLTLTSRPEAVYRALLEASAFGARIIVEAFERHGHPVERLAACGGLARQDLPMQILADLMGRPVAVSGAEEISARGAAMLGAVAAGAEAGGRASLDDARRHMAAAPDSVRRPDPGRGAVYAELYRAYKELHDHFGRGGSAVMRELAALRARVASE
jgi:L-ribulokinase